jgi:hypothetical protein
MELAQANRVFSIRLGLRRSVPRRAVDPHRCIPRHLSHTARYLLHQQSINCADPNAKSFTAAEAENI